MWGVAEDKYSPHEIAFAHEAARRREQRGWTLGEMADALRSEGIDYANSMTVSRTEKLQRPIRMNEALAYARIFQTSVDQMTSTGKIDREILTANELAEMVHNFMETVLAQVGHVRWNWLEARKVRDELMSREASEMTPSQQERHAEVVRRLDALIATNVPAELERAWNEAPGL
ncbi:hypothetical protein DEJ33_15720 [Curtobacterium sp. MCPF17_047]|nr:hypothetical protein DEJ33_15720 [Curtobacterium sp. MCPF17_047]